MHQTMWVTPGKGKNSSNILSSILSFSTNNEEMTCYTTSNMKCLEYKSSLLSRIKQLDYFVHLGFRIISVKPSPQQWYQLTLKHALAQQAENLATVLLLTAISKCVPQSEPNYLKIVLHLVSSSVLQIYKKNTQKQTEASLNGTTYKWIQLYHIKCS